MQSVMENSVLKEFNVDSHLNAYWLRPESALWDAIAARQIARELADRKDIMEIGIGNGFFSFLMLGGRFKSEFDWFHSVNTQGFWDHTDIFDFNSDVSITDFIDSNPHTRIRIGVDHKQSLLNQATQLGFVDTLLKHDCNLPIPIETKISTVYSNILYWLADPMSILHQIGEALPSGGEFVAAFPNSDFYKNCSSYTSKDVLSKLINRGRANHIMWHMDLLDFEREIAKRGTFELRTSRRYLSPLILKAWDIGLRPLSIPLIRMANSLSPGTRLEIKQEWCDTIKQFVAPLLENELEYGGSCGGFNLVRLVKR